MRARLLGAAIASLITCSPAQSAIWVLDINASIKGTLTVQCAQLGCTTQVTPFSGPVTDTIGVEEFLGSAPISDTIIGRFGGRYGGFQGTIFWDGENLFGRDFLYSEDNFISQPSKQWTGSASTFAVSVHPGSPGPVPEPSTWAMMLLGFGGIGFAMRRRRRVTALRGPRLTSKVEAE